MNAKILAATALMLILGVETPVKAERVCSVYNGQYTCQEDSDYNQNDRYYRGDRRYDNYNNRRYDRNSDYYDNRRQELDDKYDKVIDIYRDMLGRKPSDRGVLRYYARRLNSGWSIQDVRRDIANSHEVQQAINQIYLQELGRHADLGGMRSYTRRLEEGSSLNKIRRDIRNSSEARSRRIR